VTLEKPDLVRPLRTVTKPRKAPIVLSQEEVARVLLGDAPDFHVAALGYGDAGTRPLYFVFGAFAGLLAIAYNRALLAARAGANRLARAPVQLRAGLVGAVVGILGWFVPTLIGGGDAITRGPWQAAFRWPPFPPRSWSGSRSGQCRTPQEPRAASLRPCWSWGPNSAFSRERSAGPCCPI
jgi:hypothetical protein